MSSSMDEKKQLLAESVGERMLSDDHASRSLGIQLIEIGPGFAAMKMQVRSSMLNGLRVCHGGFITTLADSALAFASNSGNRLTLAATLSIELIAPANLDDILIAKSKKVFHKGKSGYYTARVTNQHSELIALLNGRTHTLRDRAVI